MDINELIKRLAVLAAKYHAVRDELLIHGPLITPFIDISSL
jgi:hypothetical protein